MRGIRSVRRALTGLALVMAASSALAEPVVLETRDGVMKIKGDLIDYSDGVFTIRSSMGVVRIPESQVTCTGAGCPDGGVVQDIAPDQPVALRVHPKIGADFVAALLEAYSAERGGSIVRSEGSGGGLLFAVTAPAGNFTLRVGLDNGPAPLSIGFRAAGGQAPAFGERVLGIDPMVALASADLQLRSLSLRDLGRAYAGTADRTTAFGSNAGKMQALLPSGDPEAASVLREVVLEPQGLRAAASVIETADPAEAIRQQGLAVALVSNKDRAGLRAAPLVGPCGLTAAADPFSVKAGEYPLQRYLVVRSSVRDLPAGLADFLDFAESGGANEVIEAAGFVSQKISRANQTRQLDWLGSAMKLAELAGTGTDAAGLFADLSAMVEKGQRLSPTLRGGFGPGPVDGAVRGAFARLAEAASSGALDGHQIVFAGFDAGAGTRGLTASRTLAEQALDAFLRAAPEMRSAQNISFAATGFGGIAPVFCGPATLESTMNRRVEIWLRPL